MRWSALVLLVVTACSCGGEAGVLRISQDEVEQAEAAPNEVSDSDLIPEPTRTVAPPTTPGVLCWSIEPAVELKYPTIKTALEEAHGRWGWAADLIAGNSGNNDCLNRVRLVDMPANADGTVPAGAQITRARTAAGGERTAAQGGVSDLWINANAELWPGDFDSCRASWIETGVGHTMLMRVLTHELGHILGLEHVEVRSTMFGVSGECWDPLPSADELASAL